VDLTANLTASVPATVTLTWGPWRWQRVITIRPGLVQFGQGGTLLFYGKLHTTGRTGINPADLRERKRAGLRVLRHGGG
jgi:hypothetical protein